MDALESVRDDNTSPATHLSTFETLPREIRDQIYDNLLAFVDVETCVVVTSYPRYRFHIAILATNHKIAKEAEMALLRRNMFIVVSTTWTDENLFYYLLLEGIVIISKSHAETFTQHHLHVHLTDSWNHQGHKPVSFLMIAEHLPKLTRLIRLQTLVAPRQILLQLHVRATKMSSPSLNTQKRLLEPFKKVHCRELSATLVGEVDPGYRVEVLDAMMSMTHKGELRDSRHDQWDAYLITKEKQIEANNSFKAGHFWCAMSQYQGISNLYCLLEFSFDDNDNEFESISEEREFRCLINADLTSLRMKHFVPPAPDTDFSLVQPWFKASDCVTFLYYRGLICVEMGERDEALTHLRAALKYAPEDRLVLHCVETIEYADPHDFKRYGLDTASLVADHVPVDEPEGDEGEEKWLGWFNRREGCMDRVPGCRDSEGGVGRGHDVGLSI